MREFELNGIEDKLKKKEAEITQMKRAHKAELKNLENQITETQEMKETIRHLEMEREKWKQGVEEQGKKEKELERTWKEEQEKEIQNLKVAHGKEIKKWEKAAEVYLLIYLTFENA